MMGTPDEPVIQHPRSLWGTGAPFVLDGKVRSHPLEVKPSSQFGVLRNFEKVDPGALLCCYGYVSEDVVENRVWRVVLCVEKDWGEVVTYDLVVTREPKACPLCLLHAVMES